ncbi:hypothetical protein [Deinococcus ruber]|uniref:Uncharacterized protein n=1 Tax=Deinococcus ruber TaxID=1848197 RepID=A0A918F924_9DEIO|nr:hypothetical protein [Deinococcus ruber]GGR17231.1 hypothetical protein GCM10008957_32310 [Deinococcus ruber]
MPLINNPTLLASPRIGQRWYKRPPLEQRLYREWWTGRWGQRGTLVIGFRQYHTDYDFVSERPCPMVDNTTVAFRCWSFEQRFRLLIADGPLADASRQCNRARTAWTPEFFPKSAAARHAAARQTGASSGLTARR